MSGVGKDVDDYERWKSGDILTVDEALAEMAFWAGEGPRGRNADGSYKSTEIYVGTEFSHDWQKTPTLRGYRERHERRSK